ncbi:hypothetical protein [Arthrobacter woluwensis]|uniref:hypothetical protein n=1 Tax=Arthrobacter woluwensis TaxID=156980 RepID=UPI0020C87F2C|nr:hypothetical protein [Arthrobacter woluwensis]
MALGVRLGDGLADDVVPPPVDGTGPPLVLAVEGAGGESAQAPSSGAVAAPSASRAARRLMDESGMTGGAPYDDVELIIDPEGVENLRRIVRILRMTGHYRYRVSRITGR